MIRLFLDFYSIGREGGMVGKAAWSGRLHGREPCMVGNPTHNPKNSPTITPKQYDIGNYNPFFNLAELIECHSNFV